MIRIAALDDDRNSIETEKQLTKECIQKEEYEFSGYTDTEKFLFAIEEKTFDVVLLDMELPGTNGLEVGRKVKKYQPETMIIYVTNYVQYAVEAFEVNAFRYIPKVMLAEKLPQAYKMLLEKLDDREKRYFVIKNNFRMEKIPEEQIYYLMKEKKYVLIVHKCGQSKSRMTLEEAYGKLCAEEFVRIDRSCIVSLRHIVSIEKYQVKLRDGTMLEVSQPQQANVRKRISEYWSER